MFTKLGLKLSNVKTSFFPRYCFYFVFAALLCTWPTLLPSIASAQEETWRNVGERATVTLGGDIKADDKDYETYIHVVGRWYKMYYHRSEDWGYGKFTSATTHGPRIEQFGDPFKVTAKVTWKKGFIYPVAKQVEELVKALGQRQIMAAAEGETIKIKYGGYPSDDKVPLSSAKKQERWIKVQGKDELDLRTIIKEEYFFVIERMIVGTDAKGQTSVGHFVKKPTDVKLEETKGLIDKTLKGDYLEIGTKAEGGKSLNIKLDQNSFSYDTKAAEGDDFQAYLKEKARDLRENKGYGAYVDKIPHPVTNKITYVLKFKNKFAKTELEKDELMQPKGLYTVPKEGGATSTDSKIFGKESLGTSILLVLPSVTGVNTYWLALLGLVVMAAGILVMVGGFVVMRKARILRV